VFSTTLVRTHPLEAHLTHDLGKQGAQAQLRRIYLRLGTDIVASVIRLNNLLKDPCHSGSNEGSTPLSYHNATTTPRHFLAFPVSLTTANTSIEARFSLSLFPDIPCAFTGTDY
jgi:hypothetical protein